MDPHVTSLNLALAPPKAVTRSLLWQVADSVNHLVQKLILFGFYHVPTSFRRLSPSLGRSDIRQVHTGSSNFQTGRYAIYVLWQPGGTIPWYVRNLLEELREQQVNVIAVVNHPLSLEQQAALQNLCTT